MKRKKLLRKLESLKEMIEEHRRKIDEEKQKSFPDEGCIKHWETEISSFKEQVKRIQDRLEK